MLFKNLPGYLFTIDKYDNTVYIYTVSIYRITNVMSNELTKKQHNIFKYICDYYKSRMCSPTLAEIATHFGYSSANAARCHLVHIEKKGYITLIPRVARGLRINRSYISEQEPVAMPLLGEIAAGEPLLAVERVGEYIPVSPLLFGSGVMFALRISGDSMINAGILNGDIAVIEQQPDVDNGEIAAVILENNATLKRVFKQRDKVILKAENPDYSDIEVVFSDQRNTIIIGKYRGIIRSYQSGGQL